MHMDLVITPYKRNIFLQVLHFISVRSLRVELQPDVVTSQ